MTVEVKSKSRRGFSLFGLLLVTLGLILLLNTTGVLPFGIWLELVDYWPVLLVVVGIKMIVAPRAPVVCAGAVVLILAGTVTAAYFTMPDSRSGEPLQVSYVEPLDDTEVLRLGMGFTGGAVELSSDTLGASSYPALLTADFGDRPATVIREGSRTHRDIYFSLEVTRPVDWKLMVSPDVSLELEIKAGAADLDLDLSALDVRRVVVGAGASDIRILLPADAGRTHVEIAAGAMDIEIAVPQGVAARIENDTFVSSTQIDSERFHETYDGHQSPDYATASNRVDIEIEGFAADVTIS